jgi:hypothetical protein
MIVRKALSTRADIHLTFLRTVLGETVRASSAFKGDLHKAFRDHALGLPVQSGCTDMMHPAALIKK